MGILQCIFQGVSGSSWSHRLGIPYFCEPPGSSTSSQAGLWRKAQVWAIHSNAQGTWGMGVQNFQGFHGDLSGAPRVLDTKAALGGGCLRLELSEPRFQQRSVWEQSPKADADTGPLSLLSPVEFWSTGTRGYLRSLKGIPEAILLGQRTSLSSEELLWAKSILEVAV